MFHNLLQAAGRRPKPPDVDFVEGVRWVPYHAERSRRVECVLLACWVLIVAKCWLVTWLVHRYHMGFSPLWVTAPTVLFALICTAIYYTRD